MRPTLLVVGGSCRAKPGSAARLTPLAAGCIAFVARPYPEVLFSRRRLASLASGAPGT